MQIPVCPDWIVFWLFAMCLPHSWSCLSFKLPFLQVPAHIACFRRFVVHGRGNSAKWTSSMPSRFGSSCFNSTHAMSSLRILRIFRIFCLESCRLDLGKLSYRQARSRLHRQQAFGRQSYGNLLSVCNWKNISELSGAGASSIHLSHLWVTFKFDKSKNIKQTS